MFKSYKKINYNMLKEEKCDIQPYMKNMKYEDALLKFRLRADMVETIKCHWKNDQKYETDRWSCWHCPATDQTSHIQRCAEYADLREDLSLDNDKHLVTYFRRVIERRMETFEDVEE